MTFDKESKLIIDAFHDLLKEFFVDDKLKMPVDFKERDLQSRFYLKLVEKFSQDDPDFWKRVRVEYNPFNKNQKLEAHDYAGDNEYKYLNHFKAMDKKRKATKSIPENIIKNGTYDISIYDNSNFDNLKHAIEIKRLTACSGHQGIEDIYVLTDILDKFYNDARGYSLTFVWPPKTSKKSKDYIQYVKKSFDKTEDGKQIYYYAIFSPQKNISEEHDIIFEGGKRAKR